MSPPIALPATTAPGDDDFSSLFDFLPVGAYRSLPDGTQLRANPALVRLNGYDTEQELLQAVRDIATEWYVAPGRRQVFCNAMEQDGQVIAFVSEIYRHRSRERIWISENAHVVRGPSGELRFYEGTVEDITHRMLAEQALRRSEDDFRRLTAQLPGVLYRLLLTPDGQRRYTFVSEGVRELYGVSPEEVLIDGTLLARMRHPDDRDPVEAQMRQAVDDAAPIDIVFRIVAADGRVKSVQMMSSATTTDASGSVRVGVMLDVSARVQAEAVIWHQANFDALTGLPNRRMLRDRLAQSMKKSRREGRALAVLFIDLDHFKQVNDTIGHEKGDRLLVEASQRISRCVREADTVARFGGDEFTVVLSELSEPAMADVIAQKIVRSLGEAYELGEDTAFVSASVGITLFPDDGADIDDLLKHADQALYVAKDAGRNRVSHFTPALEEAARTRGALGKDLRLALAAQQFHVVYQPIVDLDTGRVHKAEALLRWQHPERGAVSPSTFIPIAESTGLITEIGDWVFRQAAAQVRQWRERFDAEFQVSVNKSPAQFSQTSAAHDHWFDWLAELALPGQSIVLEITETLLLDASAGISGKLLELRDAGVGVSLDDFGTGFSSLSYLQQYDIDLLKIDQSFVRSLGPGSKDLALCKAIIVMAHELGMKVVAEGVETAGQRDLLAAAGCDHAQGYFFARPMTVAAFEAWWLTRQVDRLTLP